MYMLEDQVVPISAEREKFFGCSGRMLLPSPSTVATVVEEIPSGKVATLDLLRSELARRAGVEAVCPFQTKQALRAIATQSVAVPFWRLVRKNGEMLKYLPGGVARQAAFLKKGRRWQRSQLPVVKRSRSSRSTLYASNSMHPEFLGCLAKRGHSGPKSNPSIERTSPGQPSVATHVKR